MEESTNIAKPLVETIKNKQRSRKAEGKENKSGETNGSTTTMPQPEVKVIGPKERRICRCASCGQFLFEISTDFAVIRARCRRTECKLINIVSSQDNSVNYRTEEKDSSIKY